MKDLSGLAIDQTFVAFDTEATGLSPVRDRVVELAAVAFRADGAEIASFERLIDPGVPIPPDQTLIHGITDEMVSGRPGIDEALQEFSSFIRDHVLVAHNAPSDVAMLMVPAGNLFHGNLVLDTCTLSRALLPRASNHRLSTVAETLGISRGRPHRAMPDVIACKAVFLRVLEHFGGEATLGNLLEFDGSELYLGPPPGDLLNRILLGSRGGFDPLAEAIRNRKAVSIIYRGGSKGNDPRPVTPVTVMRQNGFSCLVAHCHLDGGLKNFRLDRISAVRAKEPDEGKN